MNVRNLLHNMLVAMVIVNLILIAVLITEIKNRVSRQNEVEYNVAMQTYYDMQAAKYRAETAEARYKVQEAQLRLFLKRNNTTLKELDLE